MTRASLLSCGVKGDDVATHKLVPMELGEYDATSKNISPELFRQKVLEKRKLSPSTGLFSPFPHGKCLIKECRKGISESQRSHIWFTICSLDAPHTFDTSMEGDTSYVKALQGIFGASLGEHDQLLFPDLGGHANLNDHCLNAAGKKACYRLMIMLQQFHALSYCPMLNDLVPMFLMQMTESQAFQAITNILRSQRKGKFADRDVLRLIQTNYSSAIALVRFFKNVVAWRYPSIMKRMRHHAAEADVFFLNMFNRLFIGFLPLPVVMRMIDAYLIEGPKILCRFGLALFKLSKAKLLSINAIGPDWWDCFQAITRDDQNIDYDELVRVAFRHRYGILLQRKKIERYQKKNQKLFPILFRQDSSQQYHPLQLSSCTESHLLKPYRDVIFRSWLPSTLADRKLNRIYSPEINGRSLDTLYRVCSMWNKSSPMVLLVEVLGKDMVVGAFVSSSIIMSKSFYGDRGCFLFRLYPNPVRYSAAIGHSSPDKLCHFVLGKSEFFGVGFSKHTSACGLRIDGDLLRGTSESCDTFNNKSLVGDMKEDFMIGNVEVYNFIL